MTGDDWLIPAADGRKMGFGAAFFFGRIAGIQRRRRLTPHRAQATVSQIPFLICAFPGTKIPPAEAAMGTHVDEHIASGCGTGSAATG
jgi:hypothetical protein